MFAYAPIAINAAPYESTMLLVQKIFYFHFATWMALTAAIVVCGDWQRPLPLQRQRSSGSARSSRRPNWWSSSARSASPVGSVWAKKAWGIWWAWDARVTMALMVELIFIGYLLVRRFGGPGAEKLAAAMGIFGAATAPFVYKSVDWWRTIHPQDECDEDARRARHPSMWSVVWFCTAAFLLLFVLLLTLRVHLEEQRAALDRLYLEAEG